MKTPPLDWEVIAGDEKEWEVWTPNIQVGACIGGGKTKSDAVKDCIRSLNATIKEMEGYLVE